MIILKTTTLVAILSCMSSVAGAPPSKAPPSSTPAGTAPTGGSTPAKTTQSGKASLPAAVEPVATVVEVTNSNAPLNQLNVWLKNINSKNRGCTVLWPAWVKATPMPGDGSVPMPAEIWSGMTDWAAWQTWASQNGDLAKALKDARNALALGVAYGDVGVSAANQSKGLVALPGSAMGEAAFPYLKAVRGLAAFAIVQMRALGDSGKYQEAFDVALDGLRMLRNAAEQRMASEQIVALSLLASSLEAHRVFMADHLDKIPHQVLQDVAKKGYPFLKAGDNERLKRLELPEGDRLVAEVSLGEVFTPSGQGDPEKFASAFGAMQSDSTPLTRFGAAAFWRKAAEMHGSLESTRERLGNVYDDWWRRWRMRFYDPLVEQPSEFSLVNPARYAAVRLLLSDLTRVFSLRLKVIAELDGSMDAAGLCAFRGDNGKQWPRDLAQIFPLYAMQKLNMDPFNKLYGTFQYRNVGEKPQAIDTQWGQVIATGALLWSVGGDHEDGNFSKHDPPDGLGDVVMWPPPRQLAQRAGLIK